MAGIGGVETSKEVVRATFPDGHTAEWPTGPGIKMSASTLKAFIEICLKPTPVSVEIISTATPELPFDPPIN